MKIAVIGTRGFPAIQGGVEKHCEFLYPLLARLGCSITVFRRRPYVSQQCVDAQNKNIRFIDLWSPASQSLEAIVHTFLSALICLFIRPDIVHIHNIGPALFLPLLKVGRLSVVVTYHSPNYEHSKWSMPARMMLRLGEYFTRRFADLVIFVSKTKMMELSCRNKIHIPNGVPTPVVSGSVDYLEGRKIVPGRYALGVGRLTPEKGLHDLIEAFKSLDGDYQLVIAGDADHETDYSRKLRQVASQDKRIILTGYITGEPLNQIYTNACLFVLPSYHEGLPIALLEAMSFSLPVLVSDIPANKEVGLPPERYFKCGDVDDLRGKIEVLINQDMSAEEKEAQRKHVAEKYNWDRIAEQTIEVYRKVISVRSENK